MSERGSFTTEYIYCEKCFEEVKKVLLGRDKYLCSIIIPGWGGNSDITKNNFQLPIIAGKIGGLYGGEELHTFEDEFIPKLKEKLCHSLRIAVLAENGEQIFKIEK